MTKRMSNAFRKVFVYVASSTTTMNNSNNDMILIKGTIRTIKVITIVIAV